MKIRFLNSVSFTSAVMGILGMLIISLESNATYSREQYQRLSQNTDNVVSPGTSELSTEKKDSISARSYHSLSDLRPIPSLMNILQRYRELERIIGKENVVETNVQLLQLKRRLRALLMASSTVDQRYAFNQIKNINYEILLENRLEALDGEVEIIKIMMSTVETSENRDELRKILDSLMEEVNKLYIEIQKQQRDLEIEGNQYVQNLIKNVKVDRKRNRVKMGADEALIREQKSLDDLRIANKQAKYPLRVTNEQWDPIQEAEIARLQGRIKAMVDNLLSIRARTQAAINWLIRDIDGGVKLMGVTSELDSLF